MGDDQVRRISVSYGDFRYIMTEAKQQMFVIKVPTSEHDM